MPLVGFEPATLWPSTPCSATAPPAAHSPVHLNELYFTRRHILIALHCSATDRIIEHNAHGSVTRCVHMAAQYDLSGLIPQTAPHKLNATPQAWSGLIPQTSNVSRDDPEFVFVQTVGETSLHSSIGLCAVPILRLFVLLLK